MKQRIHNDNRLLEISNNSTTHTFIKNKLAQFFSDILKQGIIVFCWSKFLQNILWLWTNPKKHGPCFELGLAP